MRWKDIAAPFIQGFEACQLIAYHGTADPEGIYTCGWGSTGPDINADTVWSQAEADARFDADLDTFGAGVDGLVRVALTDHQKAALVSFSYNEGLGNIGKSTLLKMINAGNISSASLQFPNWDIANGAVVRGLLRRRLAEQALFNTPDEVQDADST